MKQTVIDTLQNGGWLMSIHSGAYHFERIVPTGGQFGRTKQMLVMDQFGRWLERINGWGSVERTIDLRDYSNALEAIQAALQ